MRSEKAPPSPRSRGIADLEQRIERLRAYERWRPSERIDFERIVGAERWAAYWKKLEAMDAMVHECDEAAAALAVEVAQARHAATRTPIERDTQKSSE